MTEAEARAWLQATLDVSRETFAQLDTFVALLRDEATRQNLIATSTLDHIWQRHIVDSAQLLCLAPPAARSWADLGTGAGFPGLIVAILSALPVTLIESRRKRALFLERAALALGLERQVTILADRVENLRGQRYDVISARAFAPLDRLFATALPLADARRTRWLLPKGRGVDAELEAARGSWQGSFRVEPSVTDPEAGILIAAHVRPGRGM
ncbi:MAG TPA: 16S rRNA (guanine(527)-N(7))-methyltransferase RsmG [Sphingomonadaceae bacterium]|nr:16S rRNA (guanine(527)-N(7))-methyltransferase RsmG [Sphingomonadaceae bacterium]